MPINTPKQRKLQSERIKKTKPWLKSTGARTPEGKAISKMNALMKDYKAMMKVQKELHEVMQW